MQKRQTSVQTFDPSLLPTPKAIPASQNANNSDEELKEPELMPDYHENSTIDDVFEESEFFPTGHGESTRLLANGF